MRGARRPLIFVMIQESVSARCFRRREYSDVRLSSLHGKDQPGGNIAHINEIHDEIQIKLQTLAEKCRSIAVGGVTLWS